MVEGKFRPDRNHFPIISSSSNTISSSSSNKVDDESDAQPNKMKSSDLESAVGNDANTDSSFSSNAHASTVEHLASDTVSAVRAFVEALRIEFQADARLPTKLRPTMIPLYTRMKERGIVEQVRAICLREQIEMSPSLKPVDQKKECIDCDSKHEENEDIREGQSDSFRRERHSIMLEVALPLAEVLARCYNVLDALPDEKPQVHSNDPKKPSSIPKARHRNNRNRPKPPRGMLSIQDYTDVACLLEFMVCTGILPSFDELKWESGSMGTECTNKNQATTPTSSSIIEERIRTKLPKSLAGRIPKNALRWGILLPSLSRSSMSKRASNDLSLLVHTTETVAKLVLLDRFRPMLFPRHVVDLYEAIFWAEFHAANGIGSKQGRTSQRESSEDVTTDNAGQKNSMHKKNIVDTEFYRVLGLSLPSFSCPPSTEGRTKITAAVVDPTVRASAYQTLLSPSCSLSQGTKSQNTWLRRRISALLTELATRDVRGLAAIVTVFVPVVSSSNDQTSLISGAAKRLGRTLVAMTSFSSSSNEQEQREKGAMQGSLCHQLLALLTSAFPVITETAGTSTMSRNMVIPPRSMAVIQTAWAVLEQLSQQVIDDHILGAWANRLFYSDDMRVNMTCGNSIQGTFIHQSIRQIGALCAFVPPHSSSALRILQQMFLDRNSFPNKISISSCDNKNDKSNCNILGQILRVAMLTSPSLGETSPSASKDAEWTLLWLTQALYGDDEKFRDRIVDAWISALVPTEWDLEGFRFVRTTRAPKALNSGIGAEFLEIKHHHRLEDRSEIEDFAALVESTTERAEFFVNNVLVVLAPNTSIKCTDNSDAKMKPSQSTPLSQGLPSRIFRLLLREYISCEEKHHTGMSSSSATSRLVATILLPILCEKCPQEQLLFGENRENMIGLVSLIREVLSKLAAAPSDLCASTGTDEKSNEEYTNRYEFLKSIASILLSMLIAVMELGSKLWSLEEEELLRSFLPILKPLSLPIDKHDRNNKDEMREYAAMADMAAYAMAMIACRGSNNSELQEGDMDTTTQKILSHSKEDRLRNILKDAEADLGSTQPPIRARGMVSLGKLARGFAGTLSSTQTIPKLVMELDEAGEVLGGDRAHDFWVYEVLRLSMIALGDSESYVYLAAVQTIVAVGDLCPRHILPLIASAIVVGELDSLSVSKNSINATPIRLSQEQIIKLTEALIFIIRRRAVTDEYVPIIVNLMLHGTAIIEKDEAVKAARITEKEKKLIHRETAKYFETSVSDDELNQKELWEERDVLLKTGGPVFDVEETEVVRSLRISILSELLAESSSAAFAPFLKAIVRLVVDALQLQSHSRAVTRSAALLAREVYAKVLSEGWDLSNALAAGGVVDRSSCAVIPVSVALVASGEEEVLCAILKKGSSDSISKATDPTLVSRCREALDLRVQAEETGIFTAAILVLEEDKKLGELPGIFRELISVGGESSLGIDGEKNIFQLNPIEMLE
ncbi:unnamed protein product [Pseudo-nitzschia multistriata]|uniref:RNA polymerase II assembly factor Rtp1 C-terminal domain-containing protein n=1 Tax=Pseudo-nitzschia multistriata TaxID=183589 RepID=A0A448Z488_9STRA|nr:unnamed protein product [Pseudo-nitzschia multistriata]